MWDDMSRLEICDLASRWVELVVGESLGDDSACLDDLDDMELVIVMSFFAPLEQSLTFIDEVVRITDSEDVLFRLAAGVLEEVLSRHGEECMDWFEARARDEVKFRVALRGMYQHLISDEVWARIQLLT